MGLCRVAYGAHLPGQGKRQVSNTVFDDLSVTDFHGDIHRNIASLRLSQNLYDDLTESADGWQAAIDLELATKPHTYSFDQAVIDRPFEEACYIDAIEFPFKNWAKTRYSDGSFGVWYGADSLETTVYETVYHWRYGLLEDAGWQNIEGITIERKLYLVRCDAALLDFRPKVDDSPALIDKQNYRFTQQTGSRLHHDGHPGLVTKSARCDGDVYAVFNRRVLSSPRQLCYLTYQIKSGQVIVERQPGEKTIIP